MNICRKCDNANVDWNGAWMQCANCGEVHERKGIMITNKDTHSFAKKVNNSLQDIAAFPLKVTFLGKLTSRFNLMMR